MYVIIHIVEAVKKEETLLKEETSVKKEDNKTRNNILNGNIPRTMLSIILPLFAFAMLDKLYTLFDTFVITLGNVGTVDGIAYLGEIKNLINCIGWAICTAMSILISQAIGAKDTKKANKYLTSTFYAMCAISAVILFVFVGFGLPILKLMGTPQEVITSSYGYYVVTVISVVIGYFTTIYTSLEQAKGRTKMMLLVNVGTIAIKMAMSSILAFGHIPGINNTHFAWATIIAQCFMLFFAIKTIFGRKQTYRVQKGYSDMSLLKLIIKVGLPLFIGSFVFYGTKIFINSKLSQYYGITFVTIWNLLALICSFTEQFSSATRTATNTMVAQNFGCGNYSRVKKVYWWGILISFVECIVVLVLLTIFKEPVISFVTRGDPEKYSLLLLFFAIQKYDYVNISINDPTLGALCGLGKTNANMINQVVRTLIIRVPVVFIFHDLLKLDIRAVPLLPTTTNIIPLVIIFIWLLVLFKNIDKLKAPKAVEEKTSESSAFISEYKKNKRKVLAFDCDGTLVTHKNILSDKTYKALSKASEKHTLILATGRGLDETMPIFRGRPVNFDYMVCCDGAVIYDIKNNVIVNYNEISKDWLKDIVAYARKKNSIYIRYFTVDGKLVDKDTQFRNMPKRPIIKLIFYFNTNEQVEAFVKYINDTYISLTAMAMRDSFSDKTWVTITYRGMNKGERLNKLITLIGFSSDDAIAFGDSVNDISMFNACKTSVAVDNAVPELKEIATYTTKSYEEDGVAYWLNKNIN